MLLLLSHRIVSTCPQADAWDRGNRSKAFDEWDFACETISTGCKKYKDVDGWLTEVRRWPPTLVDAQRRFLERKPPLNAAL